MTAHFGGASDLNPGRSGESGPRIVDGLVFFGRDNRQALECSASVDDLAWFFQRYGIASALCVSLMALRLDPLEGNERVFEAAARDPRIIPCPVALPPSLDRSASAVKEQVDEWVRRGARSILLAPDILKFPASVDVTAPILERAQELRVPVSLLACDQEAAAVLARAYPGIPFLLHYTSMRNRAIPTILENTPNLCLSLTPGQLMHRTLELVCRRHGAGRYLYAGGFPWAEPGSALQELLFAPLDDEARGKVAGGTLQSWIDAVCVPDGPPSRRVEMAPPTEDPLDLAGERRPGDRTEPDAFEAASLRRERLPLDDCVDMHVHAGGWFEFDAYSTTEQLIREMDRLGVKRAWVSHHASMTLAVEHGNDHVLRAVDRFPDRLVGYAVCSPRGRGLGVREVERCVDRGMQGIKLHDANGYAYTDPGYREVWELANERGIPVLLHTWSDLEKSASLFERYRATPTILAHAGAGGRPHLYVEYISRFPQLFVDLCYSRSSFGMVEYFVQHIGAGRILYGSDAPWCSMASQLGRVAFARIEEWEKRAILSGNARRIADGTWCGGSGGQT